MPLSFHGLACFLLAGRNANLLARLSGAFHEENLVTPLDPVNTLPPNRLEDVTRDIARGG
jgi:hypothetical protein